jgi:hypothetical protein
MLYWGERLTNSYDAAFISVYGDFDMRAPQRLDALKWTNHGDLTT